MTLLHRRNLRAGLLLALAIVLGASLVSGLAGSFAAGNSPSPAGKVTLHVGWTAEPDNLNPFIGYESSSMEIWHLNYDFLVGFRAADLQPTPELATSWSQSASGKIWTFKLRHGVTWQDGQPFTARDVVFTFDYIIKNDMLNFTNYTGFIKSATALDDHTVRFTCSKPKANMLGMPVYIVPAHIWSRVSPKDATTKFANTPPIVGTGAFQVVDWKKGDYVKMEANPSYWRGRPKVDEIVFSLYQNPDSMAADLKAKTIDVAWNIPQAQFGPMGQTPGMKAIGAVVNGFTELGFNCYTGAASLGNPVLRDPKFRQALNYAVDKQKLVDVAYYGHATPATTIIRSGYYPKNLDYHWEPPASMPAGSDIPVAYTFDPAKAKTALDAAGYTDTNGDGFRDYKGKPIVLRLFVRSQEQADQRMGKLITSWLGQIGLKIKLEVMDEGAMTDKLFNYNSAGRFAPDYDLFIWYWFSDPDPNFILSVFTTSQLEGWSDCNYSNPEYDSLFLEQQTTVDQQARKAIVWKMQQILYRDSPYVVLAYPQWLEAYNDADWTGWVRSPAGDGGVVYNYYNVDSYLFVHPKTAATQASGGASNAWIAIIVAGLAAVSVVAAVVLRRRSRRAEED